MCRTYMNEFDSPLQDMQAFLNALIQPGMISTRAHGNKIFLVLDVLSLLVNHRLHIVEVIVDAIDLSLRWTIACEQALAGAKKVGFEL